MLAALRMGFNGSMMGGEHGTYDEDPLRHGTGSIELCWTQPAGTHTLYLQYLPSMPATCPSASLYHKACGVAVDWRLCKTTGLQGAISFWNCRDLLLSSLPCQV